MGSLSVQIFSAIYVIVLIIIYFSKKRINSIENKIFSSLIITNLIGVILDLISTSTALYMKDAVWLNIVSKFYLVYLITWLLIFTLYVYYISTTTKKNKKENKVQCLPGILSEDPALYYYEYMDTSKLNSNRSNTTQKEKNRR